MQHGSTAVLWKPDLLKVMDAVEKRGLKDLNQEAAQALWQLLTQVHKSTVCTHRLMGDTLKGRISILVNQLVRNVMEPNYTFRFIHIDLFLTALFAVKNSKGSKALRQQARHTQARPTLFLQIVYQHVAQQQQQNSTFQEQ